MRLRRDKIAFYGVIGLIIAPIVLGICAVIQGTPYVSRIVKPTDSTWSFNPFYNFWTWVLITGFVVMLLAGIGSRRQRFKPFERLKTLFALFIGGCLLGLIVINFMIAGGAWLNCRLDDSPIVQHEARVTQKIVARGKTSTSYYLIVNDWRDRDTGDVQILAGRDSAGYDLHQIIREGDDVVVSTRHGLFGLDWVVDVKPIHP